MAAEQRIWMPLYIGDYLAGTIAMTNAQHGAYLKAIMAYWRKGGPLNRAELQNICGREFDVVSRKFEYRDDHYHHHRITLELERASKRMNSAKEKAMKGVAARSGKVSQ